MARRVRLCDQYIGLACHPGRASKRRGGLSRILGEEKRRDFSHRRKQAVLGFRLAQHRLFRPVRSKLAKNLGQTREEASACVPLTARLYLPMTHQERPQGGKCRNSTALMKLLAVDIGTGTQDILLFDTEREVENCLKLVMPSPTLQLANAVRSATQGGDDILLSGVQMGGGPCVWAVRDHLRAGYRVYATPDAARTFDDDLEQVRAMGITLVSQDEALTMAQPVIRLHMGDFNYQAILGAFARFGVRLDRELDGLAVAVFDHGNAPPGVSDRLFRFEYLAAQVRATNRLSAFAYSPEALPVAFTRLAAVASCLPQRDWPALLMDSAPAAVLGTLEDPVVRDTRPLMVLNVGNFHSLAFRLGQEGIEGLFEHHTGELTVAQLDDLLEGLAAGSLTHQQVFDSNGHGAFLLSTQAIPPQQRRLAVVGPRRSMLRTSRHAPYFAVPFGDMMMAGCYGLVRAFADVYPESSPAIQAALAGGRNRSLW